MTRLHLGAQLRLPLSGLDLLDVGARVTWNSCGRAAHFRKIEQGQRDLRVDLDRTQPERDEQRKAFLRGSMKLQVSATGLFVLGVVMSVLGNAWTC